LPQGFGVRSAVIAAALLAPSIASANQTGINGRSGKYTRFCITCHTGGAYATVVSISGPASLLANQRASYTVTIATNGAANAAGFNAAIERIGGANLAATEPELDPHDDDDGTLFATDPGTRLIAGEVSHTGPRSFAGGNQVMFTFQWEPHEAGSYDVYAAGNAVDRTGTDQNDHPALASPLAVTVCDDSDVDGVCNDSTDNCPDVPNPRLAGLQPDCDGDGIGDACDTACAAAPACAGLCFPGTCGDGMRDAPEAEDCDDGDTLDDGDGCSAACLRNNVCGDGVVQGMFELCDDGTDNSDIVPDACRTNCVPAHCGDKVVAATEDCDDGNTIDDGNGCDATCAFNNVCGDGDVEAAAEECDDGNIVDDGNGCSATCTNNSICGNGNLEALFEECDDGDTIDTGNGCDGACHHNNVCGDGIVAPVNEACDDGDALNSGNGCSAACVRLDVCGDGVRASLFELCDQGVSNSDVLPDRCRTSCRPAFCGDGVVDSAETCDDGVGNSDVAADACRTDCTPARCGDGAVDSGEVCDDGAQNSATAPDACRPDCCAPRCGDTVVDGDEECDDGDDDSGDGCSAGCALETCGDGIRVDSEECDDGPQNSDTEPDACRSDCSNPHCGDGIRDGGEACDDGSANSDIVPDGCRTDCSAARCGDGVVDSDEACDPMSGVPGEQCTDACTLDESGSDGCNDLGGRDLWLLLAPSLRLLRRRRVQPTARA
jgi:cysteine-rich repeat protein